MDKLLLPSTPATEFPGPLDLSKIADSGGIYPEIPIHLIQKVATERCAIPPLEVTAELLLAASSQRQHKEDGSSQQMQQAVFHG